MATEATDAAKKATVADSVAAKCRYGENAAAVWGSWLLLWEDSQNDYQGSADFIAKEAKEPDSWRGDKYVHVAWSYGSCSGCDEWEHRDLSSAEVIGELTKTAAYYSRESLRNQLDMYRKEFRPGMYDAEKYAARIAAIEAELATEER